MQPILILAKEGKNYSSMAQRPLSNPTSEWVWEFINTSGGIVTGLACCGIDTSSIVQRFLSEGD